MDQILESNLVIAHPDVAFVGSCSRRLPGKSILAVQIVGNVIQHQHNLPLVAGSLGAETDLMWPFQARVGMDVEVFNLFRPAEGLAVFAAKVPDVSGIRAGMMEPERGAIRNRRTGRAGMVKAEIHGICSQGMQAEFNSGGMGSLEFHPQPKNGFRSQRLWTVAERQETNLRRQVRGAVVIDEESLPGLDTAGFFVILAAPDKDGGRNQFLAQHFGEAVQLAKKSEAQILQVVGAEMGIGQKVPAGDQINIISPALERQDAAVEIDIVG
ncbi:MAG: hypothetical protein BWX83_01141 [Candidatus Cloacimonetes bacterium ADurb.Bin117]|nr:MAG: hypothetical protein BWX83_01141 [Candidatus Cloacimonetes bacterium ADurb.Bin117]